LHNKRSKKYYSSIKVIARNKAITLKNTVKQNKRKFIEKEIDVVLLVILKT
jgi:hypothetical protein